MPGEDDPPRHRSACTLAQADGFATSLQPIPLPTGAKRLADLLADYLGKLGVGGLRR